MYPLLKTSIFNTKFSVFSKFKSVFTGVLLGFLYGNKERLKDIDRGIRTKSGVLFAFLYAAKNSKKERDGGI